jgi:hypothetical protein
MCATFDSLSFGREASGRVRPLESERRPATLKERITSQVNAVNSELEAQHVTELPARDALSLVNLNAAVPINLGAALNVLSDGSAALAGANQNTPINQGMMGTPPPAGTG